MPGAALATVKALERDESPVAAAWAGESVDVWLQGVEANHLDIPFSPSLLRSSASSFLPSPTPFPSGACDARGGSSNSHSARACSHGSMPHRVSHSQSGHSVLHVPSLSPSPSPPTRPFCTHMQPRRRVASLPSQPFSTPRLVLLALCLGLFEASPATPLNNPCLLYPASPHLPSHQAILHAHAAKEACRIAALTAILDAKTGAVARAKPRAVGSNQSAIVELSLDRGVCLEAYSDFRAFGRIALREGGRTLAVGIIMRILATSAP
ncbi:unnamed protein product [Closterium sp. NIES-54]